MKRKYILVFHFKVRVGGHSEKRSIEKEVECNPDELVKEIEKIKGKMEDIVSKITSGKISDIVLHQIFLPYQ